MDIEEHIKRAIADGKFSNLAGEGKPLHLEDNPYEDPEWRLAHHMLRSSGFSLPWIELRKEIETELEAAQQALALAWERRARLLGPGAGGGPVEDEWRRACQAYKTQIEALNRKIFTYNLQVPSTRFALLAVNVDREILKLSAPSHPD